MRWQRWIVRIALCGGLIVSACNDDSAGTMLAQPCENGVCPVGFVCMTGYCVPTGGETGESETGESETGEGETGDGDQSCGDEWVEKDGTTPSIMSQWGAPCMQSADCVPLLGADAECLTNFFGVYELPGGFCTKFCDLPDAMSSFQHDHPTCDPAGGVTCVGAQGIFTACMVPCVSHSECGREGYGCRTMPTLAAEGDPTFCLMDPEDCVTDGRGP